MSQKKFSDIQVGDLLWDDVRKIFGLVIEELDSEADTWIANWNDGRTVWIHGETVINWKTNLYKLRKEHNV